MNWQRTLNFPPLLSDTVQVWCLDVSQAHQDFNLLNKAEQQRAQQFKTPFLQQRFIQTRAFLRALLASHLSCTPQSLCFETGSHGKLFLASNPVFFNLAHSGNLALVAVTTSAEVGIDVEQIRSLDNIEGIAKRVFSAEEYAYWQQCSAEQRDEIFFTLWSRKEAVTKCSGLGLAAALQDITTTNKDGLILTPIAYDEVAPIFLTTLPQLPYSDYAAALAVQAAGLAVECYEIHWE